MMLKINRLLNQAILQNQMGNIEQEVDEHFELIKIIQRYQQCHGWTMLIAPNHLPNKTTMKEAGVNLDKVLVVHKKNCPDVLFSAYQALKNDNCSALVIWEELISEIEWQLLQSRAQSTSTKLYLLNNKTHDQYIELH